MQFKIDFDNHGVRIDKFLTANTDITRSRVQKAIELGLTTVNGEQISKNFKLTEGDLIEFEAFKPESIIKAMPGELEVVFENDDFFVINKPQGITVHPSISKLEEKTLINILLHHNKQLSTVGAPLRPGLVHRIDKDTSGLLLIAKNDKTHYELQKIFAERKIDKHYRCLVFGIPKSTSGTIDAPLMQSPIDPTKVQISISQKAKNAITHFKLLESFKNPNFSDAFSTLDIKIETGRTHQIRVHLRSIGLPICGDSKYGNKKDNQALIKYYNIDKQILQAYKLEFELFGEKYSFELPEPQSILDIKKDHL